VNISVGGPKTVGNLVFTGPGDFLVTGGAGDLITLDNGGGAAPTISTAAGTQTVTAPLQLTQATELAPATGSALTLSGAITGQALSTTGPGTVNLAGAQNYTALNALAGTTHVHGSFTGGTAAVTANTVLNFSASQTLSALHIGAGGIVTLTASGSPLAAAPTVVPEPGTIALLASWSLLILWRVRRVRAPR